MKKFYITTALPYVNDKPHLGFALEIVQADVLARYHRLLGQDVLFLTGTDEHGAKVAKAAKEAGMLVSKFVNQNARLFQKLTKVLNISNTDFIRTTNKKRHWPAVKKVWLKLVQNGDIYKKIYQGLYCPGCEAFITKKDLKDGKCINHKISPEVIEEENYFFRLSKYAPAIKKAINNGTLKIVPEFRKNEILNFIKQGVEDISFSRPRKDLKWGIPVPGDNSQTIYVWVDALTNYISALNYHTESYEFKKYWPADIQCIGKDILRFHAVIWPGILLALKLPLPKILFVHGFITVSGQKMSKSLGNVVDPFELVEKYGADAVRYYLLREVPSVEDGDFTYEKFKERYNADLANGLGNLIARIISLAIKLKTESEKVKTDSLDFKIISKTYKVYQRSMSEFKFNEALVAIWNLISWCDKYIGKKRPWENKDQKSKLKNKKVVGELLFTLTHIAKLLQPFLPETSQKIFKQLGIDSFAFSRKKHLVFNPRKCAPLFPRLV